MGLLTTFSHTMHACNNQRHDFVEKKSNINPIPTSKAGKDFINFLTLIPTDFQRELLVNGKLGAKQKATLRFPIEGVIAKVAVREGEHVNAGQLIASLNDHGALQLWSNTLLTFKEAQLNYEDYLLRAGYRLADTTDLDMETKAVAKLRSGLSRASLEKNQALRTLADTRLIAPFAGKVANLKAKEYNASGNYEEICTLVDDGQLEVTFRVLEQELPFIREATDVEVIPHSNVGTAATGRICSVNPLIDDAGMVEVKAQIANTGGRFLDGMGVRVKIRQRLDGQLVVPKEAVLDRQGRKVVFTLENDSVAKWNYVELAGENSSQFAIASGLKPGDSVIHKGNFNLAHDKVVLVIQ